MQRLGLRTELLREKDLERRFPAAAIAYWWDVKHGRGAWSQLRSSKRARKAKKFVKKFNRGTLPDPVYLMADGVEIDVHIPQHHQPSEKSLSTNRMHKPGDDGSDDGDDSSSGNDAWMPALPPKMVFGAALPAVEEDSDSSMDGEALIQREEALLTAKLQHSAEEGKKIRKLQDRQMEALDTMLPKATGKDARLEKKRVAAEKKRMRDVSPEQDHFGGQGPSFERLVNEKESKKAKWQDKKRKEYEKQRKEYEAKEELRLQEFRRKMGLG